MTIERTIYYFGPFKRTEPVEPGFEEPLIRKLHLKGLNPYIGQYYLTGFTLKVMNNDLIIEIFDSPFPGERNIYYFSNGEIQDRYPTHGDITMDQRRRKVVYRWK